MPDSTYSGQNIRASLRVLAFGKAFSAPASIALIFLFATLMTRDQYAAYVAAVAVLEVSVEVGTCGLDWLTQTVLPSVRVHGNARQLSRSVRRLLTLQLIPYLILAGAVFVFADLLSRAYSSVVSADVLRIFALVVLVEGMARYMRDQMMSALLMQAVVQKLQILRLLVLLALLGLLRAMDVPVTASHIGYAELAIAVVGAAVSVGAIGRFVRHLPVAEGGGSEDVSRWFNRESARFAVHAYGSFLLSITLGQQIIISFVARYLGADATAQFGLCARLVEQIRKYLPMDLLWPLIRPALIGRFEREGHNFGRLVDDVGTILRANLLLLGAVAVVFAGAGDDIVRILTHGNIHVPVLLLALLLPQVLGHSLRRSLELMVFLVGRSRLFLIGSFASLLMPLSLGLLLPVFGSLYVVSVAMMVTEALFCSVVYFKLLREGRPLKFDVAPWGGLLLGIVLSATCTAKLIALSPSVSMVVAAVAAGLLMYAATVLLARVASQADLDRGMNLVRARARSSGA